MITEIDRERMREACEVAKGSNDTVCKVGAVVYGMRSKKEGMKKISSSYNWLTISEFASFQEALEWTEEDRDLFIKIASENKDLKRLLFCHAEDLIHTSRKYIDKNVLYITKFPCGRCCNTINDLDIKRVVCPFAYEINPNTGKPSKWYQTQMEGLNHLRSNNVTVEFIPITMINGAPHLTEDLENAQ